ncbi:MAG: T9SS type A sorting domain-containing protein [Candidatus Cloacimonadota bacterium]|nr:T9SS type A sorting domain-containing protein [Candidatus Cloacimonadota bacterium]
MRLKIFILIVTTLFTANLFSQELNLWQNVCNSVAQVDSEMIVNVDLSTSVLDSATTEIFYSTDGAQNWFEEEMINMDEVGYQFTLADSFLVSSAEDNFYGFRTYYATGLDTLADKIFFSMCAKNLSNSFPVAENYFTEICPDSLGDAQGASSDPFLDLIRFSGSFSEDKFYFQLTNDDDEWKTYGGMLPFLPPWYIYSIALRNPESVDSSLYAIVYADVPEIPNFFPGLSAGLYKGNILDSTFSQIGEVEHEVVDGKLQLAINIEDLTTDPDFGQWPNISGSIFCGVAFITIGLDGTQPEIVLNDLSDPCFYFPQIRQVANGDTTVPELSELTYLQTGNEVTFSILYTDASNNLPTVRKLVTGNNSEYSLSSADHIYDDGSLFIRTISLDEIGTDPVFAAFSDGLHSVISNEVFVNKVDNEHFSFSSVNIFPNPFANSVNISLELGSNNIEVENARIQIFNIKGQKVRSLSPISYYSGKLNFLWNGKNEQQSTVNSGIYFCKIQIEGKDYQAEKLILMR